MISSEGIVNDVMEYDDSNYYKVNFPCTNFDESCTYEFWENVTYHEEVEKNKIWAKKHSSILSERILSVDIHSPKYTNLWQDFTPLKKKNNLKYKDLLGTYKLMSCSKDYMNISSPIFKRILPDGTEAVLYKKKIGTSWQVHIDIRSSSERGDKFKICSLERSIMLLMHIGRPIRTSNI